jgi:hypothetical protein
VLPGLSLSRLGVTRWNSLLHRKGNNLQLNEETVEIWLILRCQIQASGVREKKVKGKSNQ